MTANKSDFQAAEEIKNIVQGKDIAEVEKIFRWVTESLGLKEPAKTAENPAITTPPGGSGMAHASPLGAIPKDIRSFVQEKAPKKDIQLAATIAYYFLFVASEKNRKETISAKDLNEACRQARSFGLKDAGDTLNNAMKQGYFDRATRGNFKLNSVGENLVAMALPGTGGGAASSVRNKKRASKGGGKKRAAK
jgi:hypothetical protein